MARRRQSTGMRFLLVVFAIALIGAGAFFMITGGEPPEVKRDFEAGAMSGTVYVQTALYDEYGNLIRQTDPDAYGGTLVDPNTDKNVEEYRVKVGWECTGSNLDWDTLRLVSSFTYVSYVGVDDRFNAITETKDQLLDDVDKNINMAANHEYSIQDVQSLMPEYIYPDGGGGENFPQYTTDPHAVIFNLRARFELSVSDDYGNEHSASHDANIQLRLAWAGSEFEVEWNTGDDTTEETTTTTTDDGGGGGGGDDMTRTTSDEEIELTETDEALYAGFIGGMSAESSVGLVLAAAGFVLIMMAIMMPVCMRRR